MTARAKGYCWGHLKQIELGKPLAPLKYHRGDCLIRDEDGNKMCSMCHKWLPVDQFAKYRRGLDGLYSACRECRRNYRSAKGFNGSARRHNLGEARLKLLLDKQNGMCAICGESLEGKKRLFVDHDHSCCPGVTSCGKCVRGLLCRHCNPMLGYARDSVENLERAIEYLKNPITQTISDFSAGRI